MRERARDTVSQPDGGSQNGSGRCGGILSSRRNRSRRENPPPTRQAPPPAAARPSPAPGPNRRNHAFSAAAGSEWSCGRSWRNACCAPRTSVLVALRSAVRQLRTPATLTKMSDEEFAYRTDRPVEELRKELEDLAAGWTVRPTDTHLSHSSASVSLAYRYRSPAGAASPQQPSDCCICPFTALNVP